MSYVPQTETQGQPLPREDRRRHLRIVGPAERARLRLKLSRRAGITVTVGLFGALFAVAVSHALLIEGQARLDRMDQEANEAQARYEELQAELSDLRSPDRILQEASEMGLVEPEDRTWLPQTQTVEPEGGEAAEADRSTTSYEDVKPYIEDTP